MWVLSYATLKQFHYRDASDQSAKWVAPDKFYDYCEYQLEIAREKAVKAAKHAVTAITAHQAEQLQHQLQAAKTARKQGSPDATACAVHAHVPLDACSAEMFRERIDHWHEGTCDADTVNFEPGRLPSAQLLQYVHLTASTQVI